MDRRRPAIFSATEAVHHRAGETGIEASLGCAGGVSGGCTSRSTNAPPAFISSPPANLAAPSVRPTKSPRGRTKHPSIPRPKDASVSTTAAATGRVQPELLVSWIPVLSDLSHGTTILRCRSHDTTIPSPTTAPPATARSIGVWSEHQQRGCPQ
jgi:hypothetical protein